jgi:hypothetical protein
MMAEDQLRRLLDELHRADDQRTSIPRTSPDYEQAADRVDELAQAIWRIVRSDRDRLPAEDGGLERTFGRAADR